MGRLTAAPSTAVARQHPHETVDCGLCLVSASSAQTPLPQLPTTQGAGAALWVGVLCSACLASTSSGWGLSASRHVHTPVWQHSVRCLPPLPPTSISQDAARARAACCGLGEASLQALSHNTLTLDHRCPTAAAQDSTATPCVFFTGKLRPGRHSARGQGLPGC